MPAAVGSASRSRPSLWHPATGRQSLPLAPKTSLPLPSEIRVDFSARLQESGIQAIGRLEMCFRSSVGNFLTVALVLYTVMLFSNEFVPAR